MYYYRTNDKKEIDLILEKGSKIFAIVVKSSQSIKIDAFNILLIFKRSHP
ncbi:hypothetical protein GJV85_05670 [Sulfurimonas aquatica]|uniref:DUF4143 domain-containing protein n=1 Tax=Sulfurimonas aquatica TaxID=2672570 RepID=A0A975B2K8_9BACT|nr:hypothetical protein GJV85_05670 [Sulfurimonas aquatica]